MYRMIYWFLLTGTNGSIKNIMYSTINAFLYIAWGDNPGERAGNEEAGGERERQSRAGPLFINGCFSQHTNAQNIK